MEVWECNWLSGVNTQSSVICLKLKFKWRHHKKSKRSWPWQAIHCWWQDILSSNFRKKNGCQVKASVWSHWSWRVSTFIWRQANEIPKTPLVISILTYGFQYGIYSLKNYFRPSMTFIFHLRKMDDASTNWPAYFPDSNNDFAVSYSDELTISEFWDIIKLTSSYKTLTDKLFGDDKPDTKSMELLCRSFIETPEQLSDYNYEFLNRSYINAKSNDKDYEIISDIKLKKLTISSVAYLHNTKNHKVRKILSKFKYLLKKQSKWNLKFKNKKSKITDSTIDCIESYWESMTGKSFTLNDIKLFIEKKSWAKNIISTSTIRKILIKNLRMAFKRMNKLNSSIILKEKINQIRDILFIQFKLLNYDSNFIFLDEFKFAS